MARDHARVLCKVWMDRDWQGLPLDAQWLYLHLLSHPRLTYAGTVDWRPSKIAKSARDMTSDDVEAAALPLEAGDKPLIVVDRDTEEALIRTFIKHDGLLGNGNVTLAMVKAWDALESEQLKGVISHELARIHEDSPDLRAFTSERPWGWVKQVLQGEMVSPSEAVRTLPQNPSGRPLRRVS